MRHADQSEEYSLPSKITEGNDKKKGTGKGGRGGRGTQRHLNNNLSLFLPFLSDSETKMYPFV